MINCKLKLWQLKQRQTLSLDSKIKLSLNRIKDWYEYYDGKVYVSFSGGKDSTVLLHLARSIYPKIEAVFVDTGLEYPEIRSFVSQFDNVTIIRPKMSFKQVLDTYGYPCISKKVARQIRDLQNPTEKNKNTRKLYFEGIKKDGTKTKGFKLAKKWRYLIKAPFKISERCCDVIKKEPIHRYEKASNKKAIIGNMASDSNQREIAYLRTGCFNYKRGQCLPIGFWTEKDIWTYIKKYSLQYCSIYNTGVKRTGCMFCMFGVHLEKNPNRFQLMQITHPLLYKYCLYKLGLKEVLQYLGIEFERQPELAK